MPTKEKIDWTDINPADLPRGLKPQYDSIKELWKKTSEVKEVFVTKLRAELAKRQQYDPETQHVLVSFQFGKIGFSVQEGGEEGPKAKKAKKESFKF